MNNKKLDFWVYFVRFYSGYLNAGMLLTIGTMLTLHSGNMTRVSMHIIYQEWELVIFPLVATLSYFVGAFLTHAYYAEDSTKLMTSKYWQGYFVVGILFIILWILPIGSWPFIIIMSIGMAIICSMPLPNRGYTGTITILTGLITTLAQSLSYWMIHKSEHHKGQSIYLANNLLAYILGAMVQTFVYIQTDIVRAWPLMLQAFFLAYWAYRHGLKNQQAEEAI